MDIETYRRRYATRPPKLLAEEIARLEKRFQGFQEQLDFNDPRLTDAMNEWQGARMAYEAMQDPKKGR